MLFDARYCTIEVEHFLAVYDIFISRTFPGSCDFDEFRVDTHLFASCVVGTYL